MLLAVCALVCLFGFAAPARAATPGKPVAKAPKGTLIATRPTFTWGRVGGATRYEVRVYKGGKLLVKKTGIKTLSWKCTKTLPLNVSLTWTVRAANAHATGAWSKALAFKVVSPYAPQGAIATLTPTCKWIKVKGATRYEVRVYQGARQLLRKTGLKTLSWKVSRALPVHVSLTWRVRGSKGAHRYAWKTFKFTVVPPATQIAANAGDAQTAIAGAVVAIAPSVIVKDAYNYPVSGVTVTFAVASGGGSATALTATTNAAGIATVGSWTLGAKAGADTLTATSAALTGSPVTFTATGVAGPADPAQSTIVASNTDITAGDGTQVITVTVRDANGNPVTTGGADVAITLVSGTGFVGPVTDNGDGTYSATVTAPDACGSGVFAATVGGGPVDGGGAGQALITVTYLAGPADTIQAHAGDSQSAVAGTAVSTDPSVLVTDKHGNPVSGASVEFAATSGGGSCDSTSATTDASGIASVRWTLGATAGLNVMTATCAGLAAPTVSFHATGTAGAAAQIVLNGGDAQAATVATPVATAPSVLVTDANGNPVSGAPVTFTVSGGGGSCSDATVTTDTLGIAAVGWTLGTAAGQNTLTATSAGLTGSPVAFTATGTAGAMAKFALSLAPAQTCGQAFGGTDTLTAQDSYGNTVTDYSALADNVTLSVAPADGAVGGLGVALGDVLDGPGDFVNGVADLSGNLTFTGLTGDHTFTATAQSGGYTGSSDSVTIGVGTATQGVLTTQPGGAVDGVALTGAPVVQLRDAGGNDVAASGVAVTASIATGNGTLSGTTNVATDANGAATFSDLVVSGVAGSYTLAFAPASLTGATSSSFMLGAGAASKLAIATQPLGGPSGALLATQPVVKVEDANGNLVATSTATIRVTSSTGSTIGGAEAAGLAASSGVATFSDLTLAGTAGTAYTLTFASTGLTPVTSANLAVTAGAPDAAHSTLTPASASITANGTSTQLLTVTAKDASGNALATGGATVTIQQISGTGTVGAVTDHGNGTYTATVTSPTLTGSGVFVATLGGNPVKSGTGSQTQATVTYVAGPANKLAIVTQPVGAASGAVLATQPVVQVQDSNGNLVTGSTATIVVSASAGSTIGGSQATGLNASGGVATFTNLTLSGIAGPDYTLTFTATGLISATSNTTTVVPGAATKLVVTTQPTGGPSGGLLSLQPVVKVEDSGGNVVTGSSATITVTSSAGSTIGGAEAAGLAASSGVATFSNLTLAGTAGTGYTLTFASTGLTSATSASLTVSVGAVDATQTSLTPASASITANGTSTQVLTVTAKDASGNALATGGATVTIQKSSGTGTIGPVTDVGNGTYTATVTSPTLTGSGVFVATLGGNPVKSGTGSQTQATVTYKAGTATQLAVATAPAGGASGGLLATQPVIKVEDLYGNLVTTSTASITVTSSAGSTIGGTQAGGLAASGGVATFTNLTLAGTAGTGYTLTYASTGLTSATSTGVSVTVGAANKLAVTTAPVGGPSGGLLATQPVVKVEDSAGNVVTTSTASITVTSSSGSTIGGTQAAGLNAASGVATFSNLTLAGTAGTGYTLTYASTGLASTTSTGVSVTAGTATKLYVATPPVGGPSGALLGTQPVVQVEDAQGNLVTTSTASITVTSSAGSTIGGTQAAGLNATGGVATFTNLTLAGTAGTGYTLTYASTGLASATSTGVSVTVGAANKLAVTTAPVGGPSGALLATQPVIKVEDAQGNVVTGSSATVTVTSSSGSTIGGTQAAGLNAASGVATFTNLTLAGTAGTGYTLTYASSGLTSATSTGVSVTPGTATQLAVTTAPVGGASGALLATQPVIKVEDAQGNVVTGSSATITVTSSTGSTIGGTQAAGLKRDRRCGHLHEPHPGGHRGYRLHAHLRLDRPHLGDLDRRHGLGRRRQQAGRHHRAGRRAQRRPAGHPAGRQGRRLGRQRRHHEHRQHHGDLLERQHDRRHTGRRTERRKRRGHLHEPHPGRHRRHGLHTDLRLDRPHLGDLDRRHGHGRRRHQGRDHHTARGRGRRRRTDHRPRGAVARLGRQQRRFVERHRGSQPHGRGLAQREHFRADQRQRRRDLLEPRRHRRRGFLHADLHADRADCGHLKRLHADGGCRHTDRGQGRQRPGGSPGHSRHDAAERRGDRPRRQPRGRCERHFRRDRRRWLRHRPHDHHQRHRHRRRRQLDDGCGRRRQHPERHEYRPERLPGLLHGDQHRGRHAVRRRRRGLHLQVRRSRLCRRTDSRADRRDRRPEQRHRLGAVRQPVHVGRRHEQRPRHRGRQHGDDHRPERCGHRVRRRPGRGLQRRGLQRLVPAQPDRTGRPLDQPRPDRRVRRDLVLELDRRRRPRRVDGDLRRRQPAGLLQELQRQRQAGAHLLAYGRARRGRCAGRGGGEVDRASARRSAPRGLARPSLKPARAPSPRGPTASSWPPR